jgi:hypothetical protein
MKQFRLTCAVLVAGIVLAIFPCQAGIRGPGKYSGVVIFDRWDGCILYSGIFVMYVSEKVKEKLHPYGGKAIQVDAKNVYQPLNPGDGRIESFEYVGPALEYRSWIDLKGINLQTSVKVGADRKPIGTIKIENIGSKPVKILRQELALTLLMKRSPKGELGTVSDGPSFALITRQSFEIGGNEPRWEGRGIDEEGRPYAWSLGKEHALPHDFTIEPKEIKMINIRLDLPDGEYDFLSGYGGGVHEGKCIVSNLSSFDIKKGTTIVVPR